jgi:hypothetical protein
MIMSGTGKSGVTFAFPMEAVITSSPFSIPSVSLRSTDHGEHRTRRLPRTPWTSPVSVDTYGLGGFLLDLLLFHFQLLVVVR